MRVLLSTIGSRGDVQPLVALGRELKTLGHEVHLCVPPDFQEWIEGLGISVTPIGPEVRSTGKAAPSATPPTPERKRQLVEESVATQFEKISAAAQGCDAIVAATALQLAARSVAEKLGIPYFFAAYCPAVIPSTHHGPPVLGVLGDIPKPVPADYAKLWARDEDRFNSTFANTLNMHRAALGLPRVDNVRRYIFTDRPWLAADATLAPWPDSNDKAVLQTGAWILPDARPFAPELEAFLAAGEPPVYFGFGSIRGYSDLSEVMIQSARACGRRALLSRGWADLSLVENAPDCMGIGEINQQAGLNYFFAVLRSCSHVTSRFPGHGLS